MAACPRCRRPIAVARPRCLYCNEPIDPSLIPAATGAADVPATPVEERTLLVLGVQRVSAAELAAALGLSTFDAEQRQRRGGWHLHRVSSPGEAATEARRLRAAGIEVHEIPEAETRAALQPLAVLGGGPAPDGYLLLRTEEGAVRVSGATVLVIVGGPIQRERQPDAPSRKTVWSALDPGYRYQLHLRAGARPIEIDPAAFSFEDARLASSSSYLELRSWIESLGVAIDDEFRLQPPALGLSAPPPGAELGQALGSAPDRRRSGIKAPPILDNLAQFRAYSGWRGAVERRVRAD